MDSYGFFPGTYLSYLDVDGDVTIGGDLTVEGSIDFKEVKTDRVLTLDGAVGTPSHSFQSATNTGMWKGGNDLKFSRAGSEILSLGATESLFAGDVRTTQQVIGSQLYLTGGLSGNILSDTEMHLATLDPSIKFQNAGFPTLEITPSEMHSYVPIRSEGKVEGTYLTFLDDPDNSQISYDNGDGSVNIQAHGDPSCKFLSKTIQGTYAVMDTTTTSTLVCTNATTTNLVCTSASITSFTFTNCTTTTLSCTTNPFVEFQNSVVQSIPTGSTAQRLILSATPTTSRGSPLPTFSTVTNAFTLPTNGYYRIDYQVAWAFQPGGFRYAALLSYPVGAPYLAIDKRLPISTAGEYTVCTGTYQGYFTTGTQFQIYVYQNSGAAVNVQADLVYPTYVRIHQVY